MTTKKRTGSSAAGGGGRQRGDKGVLRGLAMGKR